MTPAHKIEVLDAAKRASERSAAIAHGRMKRGLNSLASIAATAPFVGIFGTVLGVVNSFPGLGTERWAAFAIETERLSDSLVPTELGLLVAMLAFCSYKYFLARLEDCDVEMQNASTELINQLASARF
jgi:biopolymer transport protein ExbB/TolQ